MPTNHRRLPDWFRQLPRPPKELGKVRRTLRELHLETVCEGARCPNRAECYGSGTATFLIAGEGCTRDCRFCAVPHGVFEPPDPTEPERIAEAARRWELRYVVITSVTRDDLPDGAAGHFAAVVQALHALPGKPKVEVLVPDFKGNFNAADTVLKAEPETFAHNVETVPALYDTVRQAADYQRSLELLRHSAKSGALTKTGLMLGLGETESQLKETYHQLTDVGVSILTLGQYLQPTHRQLPVKRFWHPQEFDEQADAARQAGISIVIAGPLVRSSYLAEHYYPKADLTRPLHS